ncbi:hypothetical protein MTO96_008492 [Rhipicephalus appendiculatus]
MPRDRYKTLSSGTPTEALAIPKPLGTLTAERRIREIAARITRSCTFKRPSRGDKDGDEAPILNEERDCPGRSSSSSSSTSSLESSCRTRLDPPAPDINPSPSWTPKGCLVFVDSSVEFENERRVERSALHVPEDCPAGPEDFAGTLAGDLEADLLARHGSPPCATLSGCLDPGAGSSSGPASCRICGHEGNRREPLVSLCKCPGAAGLLHASCLERSVNAHNAESHCETCRSRFRAAAEFSSTARLFRWVLYGEPRMQRALLGDLLLFALLTPVAALSCLLCVRGASKQLLRRNVAQAASLGTLAVFFTAAYVSWLFFAARVHYRAFAAWKASHDPTTSPHFVDGADSTGHRRTSSVRPMSPRELLDVATGSVDDVEGTSTHRQDGGGDSDVRQALLKTSPADLPFESQQRSVDFARQHSSRSGSLV